MMVDWLTVEIPCRLPEPIHGGFVVKFNREKETEWTAISRMQLEGSWSTSVQVRAVSLETLEVSGNLAKFMQGHNLYGPDDPMQLLRDFLERVQPQLWPEGMPEGFDLGGALISRIDCTSGFILDRPADVLAWLRGAHERGVRPYMGRGVFAGTDGSTLVYGYADKGKRAKAKQVTFYAKGVEIGKHPLPLPMMQDNRVIEWTSRLLRCEVRLRTVELKRLNLRCLGQWTPGTVARVWRENVERIDLMDGEVTENREFPGVKSRLVTAYLAWVAGNDLRVNLKRAAWYKLRKEVREQFGVDIATDRPKSNIVPLRRVIVAEPAQRPHWADDIDRILAAKAA